MQTHTRLWGKVYAGDSRGKTLGFPTANIRLHKQIPDGIYISLAKVQGTWHQALTFIGAPKTFASSSRRAETYILDFNRSIYGQYISIMLLKQIRKNKRFSSVAALIAAIAKDERMARAYFAKNSDF